MSSKLGFRENWVRRCMAVEPLLGQARNLRLGKSRWFRASLPGLCGCLVAHLSCLAWVTQGIWEGTMWEKEMLYRGSPKYSNDSINATHVSASVPHLYTDTLAHWNLAVIKIYTPRDPWPLEKMHWMQSTTRSQHQNSCMPSWCWTH